ncbi:biotin-dependent carboxyltransferase family protein [Pseudoalteromonas sp. T1lg65]|uniref:5-oxoprolinase subunit C family protein n=1 Tax=Pseudoalteromonas sp. T1lg65 TaxID=2077101 RepID=UPI003F7A2848
MLTIVKPGPLCTVQDMGRHSLRHLGVSQTGAVDAVAMKIANRLLENPDNSAVLEITLGMFECIFESATNFAISGADLSAFLDNIPLYPGWRYFAKAGQRLVMKSPRLGLRCYIAVEGGFTNIESCLGSKSTDIMAGFGGLDGKPLRSGEQLTFASKTKKPSIGALQPAYHAHLRCLPGPHLNFDASVQVEQELQKSVWTASPQSNRMGLRLAPHHKFTHQFSIATQAVHPGVIQLPPNGGPIILMNDCQTTGGYPIIATVIEADLHHLAQIKAGDQITFEMTSIDAANAANRKLTAHLEQLQIAIKNKRTT